MEVGGRELHSGRVFRAGSNDVNSGSVFQGVCMKKGFTLIELMIVIAIIAIIAAIAIPGLLRARIASNERNASASLKSVVTGEENFKSNDLDRNNVGDYWTGDIAGLYCLQVVATQNAISALNDIGVASADIFQNGNAYANANVTYNNALLLTPSPKSGYCYQACILNQQNIPAVAYAGNTGDGFAVHDFGKFGFMAMPVAWDSTGNHVFIVNEGASVFRRDFGAGTLAPVFGVQQATWEGATAVDYPSAATISASWNKVE